MNAMQLGKWALQLRIVCSRMGWAWSVAILALLCGALLWLCVMGQRLSVVQPPHSAAQTLLSAPVAKPVLPSGNAQNLEAFYALLGQRADTERALKILFALAKKNELSLDAGEYQWQQDQASNTARYQMTLPVKGSYRAVRQFCAQVLLALPFASLDEMSLSRESASEDSVDATLAFTLYLRDAAQYAPTTEAAP